MILWDSNKLAPPTSPVLTLHSVTSSSATVTWDRPQDDTGVREYVLHYKADGSDTWLERPISTSGSRYTLEGLRCGTGYRLYVTATNSLGTGEPGDVLSLRTRGAAPLSPHRDSFVVPNATSATLLFGAWSSGGCPIGHFSVHRRRQGGWEAIAERVDASQPSLEVRHLLPNREYTLRVSAYSEAGTTEAEYRFTTLNLTTTTLTASSSNTVSKGGSGVGFPPFYRNVAILLPVIISVAVLLVVVITVIVCLRRQMDTASNSEDSRFKGRSLEQVGLSEFPRKGSGGKEEPSYTTHKSSYYSSPTRKSYHQHQRASSDIAGGGGGNNHEYAEPYSAVPPPRDLLFMEENSVNKGGSSRPLSEGTSPYATVKRSPPLLGAGRQVVDLRCLETANHPSSSSSEGYSNRQHQQHDFS